jgi:hypothetical protein
MAYLTGVGQGGDEAGDDAQATEITPTKHSVSPYEAGEDAQATEIPAGQQTPFPVQNTHCVYAMTVVP